MRVYIIGRTSARIGHINKSERDKYFFASRKQLYKVYPEGLTRLYRERYGKVIPPEEIIVYPENGTIPERTNNIDYSADKVLSEIDGAALAAQGNGLTKKNPIGKILRDKNLGNNLMWVAIAVVLIGAFLMGVF